MVNELTASLHARGLTLLGHFVVGADERIVAEEVRQPRAIALVGNAGSALWPVFQAARERRPDLSLDRWTRETVDRLAARFGLGVLYPFDGPPYRPFTRWAARSGSLFPSPLGLTIHPTYGLWHAFRAALLFDRIPDLPIPSIASPCEQCADRPCLGACPVGAFTAAGYDFEACLGEVSTSGSGCRQGGCRARAACPVGKAYRYRPDHAAFHMTELLRAHGRH